MAFRTGYQLERSRRNCGIVADPDFTEPVIGRRFAPTRWLDPGYNVSITPPLWLPGAVPSG